MHNPFKYGASLRNRLNGDLLPFYVMLVGTLILVFFIFMWATPSLDDLRFRLVGEYGTFSWSDCIESYKSYGKLFFHDANRLANYMGPAVLTLMPGWLFGLFASFLVWLAVKLGRQITGAVNSLPGSVLMLFLFILIFPWQEQMVSRMFMLNYLLGSVIILWFINEFINSKTSYNLFRDCFGAICLGTVAGAMHEGLALPTLCGCVVFMLVYGEKLTLRRWCLVAGLLLGIFSIFLSPAIHTRTHSYGVPDFSTFIRAGIKYFYYVAPFALLCVSFSVSLLFRKFRYALGRKHMALFIFLFVSGLSTIGLCYIPLGLRVFTMTYWSAILGWPLFLLALINAYGNPSKYLVRIVSVLCCLFVWLQLGVSVYYQKQLYTDFNQAYEDAKNGASVCYLRFPIGYPLFMLHHSSAGGTLAGEYFIKYFVEHISDISDKTDPNLTVLPYCLKDFSLDRAKHIADDSPYYQYKGLVVSTDSVDRQIVRADVIDKRGNKSVIKVHVLHMAAPDGKNYSVLVPAYFCFINRNFPFEISQIYLAKF